MAIGDGTGGGAGDLAAIGDRMHAATVDLMDLATGNRTGDRMHAATVDRMDLATGNRTGDRRSDDGTGDRQTTRDADWAGPNGCK